MLHIFVILFSLFLSINATCLTGWIANPSDATVCYYLQSTPTNVLNAEKVCKNLGGHLTSIHNIFDNMFLAEKAYVTFIDDVDGQFWVGGNKTLAKWIWLDGTNFDFNDWDKGQPENSSTDNCISVMLRYGKWHSINCEKEKPFICMMQILLLSTTTTKPTTTTVTQKPKFCEKTWTHFNETGFCYKVFENATWINAENKCKSFGGHLTSVHSLQKANFIANLSFYQAPIHECPGYYEGWIGGYTQDKNVHWNWTDGTIFDYQLWGTNEPDSPGIENCLQMLISSNCHGRGRFNNYKCDLINAKFICKILPF